MEEYLEAFYKEWNGEDWCVYKEGVIIYLWSIATEDFI